MTIDIEDIYVPLHAVMDLRGAGGECFSDAAQAEAELRKCGGAHEIALPEAFRQCAERKRTGVVILGDPGAGKTTHLKRLLLSCLRKGAASVGLPEDMLPVFVHNWYRIVERGLAKDPEQAEGIAREKAEQLINRLREPDFRTRRVFELTRNPLLLTNICLVHRHRGQLPQKRARLYEECIDVLLEHWRDAKKLSIGVTAQQGRRVLQPAALWLHGKPERTRATAAELAPHIEPALKVVGWNRGNAEDFLRTIRDQSGLLTGWGVEHYGFMHLGFQEYLAAREIRSRAFTDSSVLSELARHYGESWWQEVTLLLLALENPSLFVPFMREVVRQPAFADSTAMVEMCLDDAAEVSGQPFLELLEADPGKKKEFWQRQLLALKVLEHLDADQVEALLTKLAKHPFDELRQWMKERAKQALREIVYAERGEYELVRIPDGAFMMGSQPSEKDRTESEGPLHEVRVPEFSMGRYPVTNEEYGRFLKDNPDVKSPDRWADRSFNRPRQPVVGVSWKDAQRYASWAGLRLPSEAEWEYTCRAGTRTRFCTGDTEKDLDKAGWYSENSGGQTHAVGEKAPNAWGLYDMHGNVWEWIEDDWQGSYKTAIDDGSAWIDEPRCSTRVVRGGGWDAVAQICRSAVLSYYWPDYRSDFVGFRLSRSVALGP